MNQQSRDLRREANRAFLESLQALEADIQAAPAAPTRSPAPPLRHSTEGRSSTRPEREPPIGFNPADLEQAIADIEEYLQQQAG